MTSPNATSPSAEKPVLLEAINLTMDTVERRKRLYRVLVIVFSLTAIAAVIIGDHHAKVVAACRMAAAAALGLRIPVPGRADRRRVAASRLADARRTRAAGEPIGANLQRDPLFAASDAAFHDCNAEFGQTTAMTSEIYPQHEPRPRFLHSDFQTLGLECSIARARRVIAARFHAARSRRSRTWHSENLSLNAAGVAAGGVRDGSGPISHADSIIQAAWGADHGGGGA